MNIPTDREKCPNPECEDGLVPGGAWPNCKVDCPACEGWGYRAEPEDHAFRKQCERHSIECKPKRF